MASSGTVNKVIVIGNLGNDPDLRNLPDGSSIVKLNVATSESYNDRSGQRVEKTEWHRVTFFGRTAEIIHEYARKGSKIYVEGSLTTNKWQDKEGIDRYSTEIRGREFTFLSPRNSNSTGSTYNDNKNSSDNSVDKKFDDMDDVPF